MYSIKCYCVDDDGYWRSPTCAHISPKVENNFVYVRTFASSSLSESFLAHKHMDAGAFIYLVLVLLSVSFFFFTKKKKKKKKIKIVYFFFQVSIMGRGIEEKLSIKRDKSHVLFGGTKILQHTPDKVVDVKKIF